MNTNRKVQSAAVYSYRLPLLRQLQLKGQTLTHRDGLLLEISCDDRLTVFGDICPLPGFSYESLAQATGAARAVLPQLPGHDIHADVPDLAPPSVAFAIESSLQQLRALDAGTSPPALLRPDHRPTVSVNGLLIGSEEQIYERTERLVAEGYATLKLKVGRRDVRDDIRIVGEVRKLAGDSIALRLDANRSMTPDSYEQFARAVVAYDIEYIEEPIESIRKLFGVYPDLVPLLPVALDETLSDLRPDELAFFGGGTAAIVVKPTILGFSKACRLCDIAGQLSIAATISAAFCSGVGLLPHIWLAASVNDRDVAAGFDSAAWLMDDLLDAPVAIDNGSIDLKQLPITTGNVDRSKLTEIDRA